MSLQTDAVKSDVSCLGVRAFYLFRYASQVCLRRRSGDGFPKCCDTEIHLHLSTSSSINVCVPRDCNSDATTSLCFSGDTIVHIFGGTTLPMKDLQVGDRILTGSHKYQRVYAFAHRDVTRITEFRQIFTTSNETTSPLELTGDHLVYVNERTKPVPANMVQVGDVLQGASTPNISLPEHQHVVTKILSVMRQGLYAPLTLGEDGTIVVANGIVASNYVAFQPKRQTYPEDSNFDEGYVRLARIGSTQWCHQADAAHIWLSPLRILCGWNRYGLSICDSRDSEGMLHYVAWGIGLVRWMDQASLLAQLLALIPTALALAVFVALEHLLAAASKAPYVAFLVFTMVFHISWLQKRATVRLENKQWVR
jgi:Hint module